WCGLCTHACPRRFLGILADRLGRCVRSRVREQNSVWISRRIPFVNLCVEVVEILIGSTRECGHIGLTFFLCHVEDSPCCLDAWIDSRSAGNRFFFVCYLMHHHWERTTTGKLYL